MPSVTIKSIMLNVMAPHNGPQHHVLLCVMELSKS